MSLLPVFLLTLASYKACSRFIFPKVLNSDLKKKAGAPYRPDELENIKMVRLTTPNFSFSTTIAISCASIYQGDHSCPTSYSMVGIPAGAPGLSVIAHGISSSIISASTAATTGSSSVIMGAPAGGATSVLKAGGKS